MPITTPAAAAAATIVLALSSDRASGFSQSTCFPAAIAARACGSCHSLVVLMYTALMVGSASRSATEEWALGIPSSFAYSLPRSGFELATAATIESGCALIAGTIHSRPIVPAPITPQSNIGISRNQAGLRYAARPSLVQTGLLFVGRTSTDR